MDHYYRHGYFESLPAREYLPIFWSDEELELLEGTELESKAEADRQAGLIGQHAAHNLQLAGIQYHSTAAALVLAAAVQAVSYPATHGLLHPWLMLCNRQATESDYDTDVAPLADKYKLPK